MKALHIPPGNSNYRTQRLFTGLRNSLHLNALSEFCISAKREEAGKLFITALLALLLAIPATALILANGLTTASHNLKQARLISVFMAPGTSAPVVTQLSNMLITNNFISNATLVPAQPDWNDKQAPRVIEVLPTPSLNSTSVIELADQLNALAGVEFVELNADKLARTDHAFELLGHFARITSTIALIVAGLLMLAVSHHDLKNNRITITLMKQLGGTLSDVRRPFLYRGPTLGLFAGVLGIAAAAGMIWTTSKFVDLSTYEAIISIKPSAIQLIMFLSIIILASLAATIRAFSKMFTFYNQ